ncbi:MAG: helix-turn-helix domain-containing protein [Candidatus Omnitrophota bacterium]
MRTKTRSFYKVLHEQIQKELGRAPAWEVPDIPRLVKTLRLEAGWSGAELCRRTGDLDPKTLTALEKGRIKNPTLKTLSSLARGFGLSVGDLFRHAEIDFEKNFKRGSQQGAFQVYFPKSGVRVVSFTPLLREFFCGKVILPPRTVIPETLVEHFFPVFVSVLLGNVRVTVQDKQEILKEGENLFFNASFRHGFSNPLRKEAVFMLMTAPSFL